MGPHSVMDSNSTNETRIQTDTITSTQVTERSDKATISKTEISEIDTAESNGSGSIVSPKNWPRSKKYNYFIDNFTYYVHDSPIYNKSVDPDNESASVVYVVNDSNRTNVTMGTTEVIASYGAIAGIYTRNYTSPLNESWVPPHINVTAVNSDGDIYYTGYIKYNWAYRLQVTEEWTNEDYLRRFDKTLKPGPAHPEYKETPDTD